MMFKKGSSCSRQGKIYERCVYDIVRRCRINNSRVFNTQGPHHLGGCDAKHDILCNLNHKEVVPIEIKKRTTPDWMQCSFVYNKETDVWIGKDKSKIPEKSRVIFEKLIKDRLLFDGTIPPFFERNITHEEWKRIKKTTDNFKDQYFDCPDDTIQRLYSEKGCKYIQISERGLFHLGEDVCHFGVPSFLCKQEIRIRTKVHRTKNKSGYCQLSVIVSCKPKNIRMIPYSHYSLDQASKLPSNLIYNSRKK